ncbi:MAG: hypothetical protein OXI83_16750 [Gemmatimonadota bacterium]|nr:hypothetical protein [Gemmatimonadota bacterium]
MLTNGRRRPPRGETGSGSVIGVAILFPALVLVIVAIQMLSDSARIEQGIQVAANRAARTASLCCFYTGGLDGAEQVAQASLREAGSANTYNQVLCNNDFAASSEVIFIDVNGDHVPNAADNAVPPGGTVHVFVTCRIPSQILGGFGFPGIDAERKAVAVATVDPYRHRSAA